MKFFKRTGITKQNPQLLISGFWLKAYIALDNITKLLTSPFRDRQHKGVTIPAWIKRVGAGALDGFAACVLIIIVMELAGLLTGARDMTISQLIAAFAIALLVPAVYSLLSHTILKSSFGKYVFGLTVRSTAVIGVACTKGLDPNEGSRVYGPASRFQMFAREVFKIGLLPLVPITMFLATFSPRCRTLQDFMTNTVVVYIDKID